MEENKEYSLADKLLSGDKKSSLANKLLSNSKTKSELTIDDLTIGDGSLADKLLATATITGQSSRIMIDHYSYDYILENADQKFVELFEQTLEQINLRGHKIELLPDKGFSYEETDDKFSLYRPDTTTIDELMKYIDSVHNAKFADAPIVNIDIPSPEDFGINPESEVCIKKTHHISYDVETNVHQHSYAEDYQNRKYAGGVLGSLHVESQRYIQFRVTFSGDPIAKVFRTRSGHWMIDIEGRDAFEGLLIAMSEAWISQICMSALADGQKDLISIFKEIADNYPIPLSTEVMRPYFFHETVSIPICLNSNFDVNQLLSCHRKHRKKGFQFIIPHVSPKTIKLKHGRIHEVQDKYERIFNIRLGNIPAGFRTKLQNSTKFTNEGKPEILLCPVQTDSPNVSYAIDVKIPGKACQFPQRSLAYLSKDTGFEKLGEEDIEDEAKAFDTETEFLLIEKEDGTFDLSPQSYYLFRDCLATIAAYSKVTRSIILERLENKLDIEFTDLKRDDKPFIYKIHSSSSFGKETTFATLEKITGLDRKSIEANIVRQRHFFPLFEKIITQRYGNEDDSILEEHPIYYGARIEAPVYGQIRTSAATLKDTWWTNENEYKNWEISHLDFASQYAFSARIALSFLKLVLLAQDQLDKRLIFNKKIITQRFWNTIETVLREIHNKGIIPDTALVNLDGVCHYYSKRKLQIRSPKQRIRYNPKNPVEKRRVKKAGQKRTDLLKDGYEYVHFTDLAGAIIRAVEESTEHWSKALKKIKKDIQILDCCLIDFNETELEEFGKEYYTKIYQIRLPLKQQKDNLELMLKYIITTSFGILAEGISKEDYTGKLFDNLSQRW